MKGERRDLVSNDDLGDRGQWMFSLLMTELCDRNEPYFRPRFLGDKFPTFDYLVELVDDPALFFFVQVKTTRLGYTRSKGRLKVQVSQSDVDRMTACPAPTYLVGIDERKRTGFLLSMRATQGRASSLSTEHPIDCGRLSLLAREVREYWESRSPREFESQFQES